MHDVRINVLIRVDNVVVLIQHEGFRVAWERNLHYGLCARVSWHLPFSWLICVPYYRRGGSYRSLAFLKSCLNWSMWVHTLRGVLKLSRYFWVFILLGCFLSWGSVSPLRYFFLVSSTLFLVLTSSLRGPLGDSRFPLGCVFRCPSCFA